MKCNIHVDRAQENAMCQEVSLNILKLNFIPVNLSESKMCRRCRFDKCVAVGMNFSEPMRIRSKPVMPLLQRIAKEFE